MKSETVSQRTAEKTRKMRSTKREEKKKKVNEEEKVE
jgi:hypothetical protein